MHHRFTLRQNEQQNSRENEKVYATFFDNNFTFEEKSIKVSVTIGIAERSEADTIDKWIQVADDRLYNGKTSGKNRVIFK